MTDLNPPRRRRLLLGGLLPGFLLGVLGVAAAAVLAQAAFALVQRPRHAPPGRLVDVGGHRLHLHVRGAAAGNPTVILLPAEGSFSGSWAWVQPEVARFAQAVAYDRAGLGWSEAGSEAADARHAVRQLLAALDRAEIPTPYLLVGHSLGALHAQLLADLYPDRVAGAVWLDPPAAPGPGEAEASTVERRATLLPYLAAFGLLRLANPADQIGRGLPAREAADARFLFVSVRHAAALRDELRELAPGSATAGQIGRLASQPGALGDFPLVVLSRSLPDDERTRAQQAAGARSALLSARGSHWVVPGADHFTLASDRGSARWVVAAVREVLERARQRR
jgi:pimeloyl-ACP methyl ester carboxylesterase